MVTWFSQLDPVLQALLATIFTWFMTALGAATVFSIQRAQPHRVEHDAGFCRRGYDRRQLLLAAGASDRDGEPTRAFLPGCRQRWASWPAGASCG